MTRWFPPALATCAGALLVVGLASPAFAAFDAIDAADHKAGDGEGESGEQEPQPPPAETPPEDSDGGRRPGGEDSGEAGRGGPSDAGSAPEADGEAGEGKDKKKKGKKDKREGLDAEPGAAEAKPPRVRWLPGDGIEFAPPDRRATLKVSAWLRPRVDFDLPPPGSAGPLPAPRPQVERARVGVAFELPHDVDGEVEVGFDDLNVAPTDLWIRWRPHDAFRFKVGRHKPAWGRERLLSARHLPFGRRAAPAALYGGRAVGASWDGSVAKGRFGWVLGIYAGAVSNTYDSDRNADLLVRLRVEPSQHVDFGVGGSVRFRPDLADGLAGISGPAGSLLEPKAFIGPAVSAGLDFAVAKGPIRLLGEGAVLREGQTVGTSSGHLVAGAGSLLLGLAPKGGRAEASKGGGVEDGIEAVFRGDLLHLAPAPGDRAAAGRFSIAMACLVAPTPWLRIGGELEVARRYGVGQDAGAEAVLGLSVTAGL